MSRVVRFIMGSLVLAVLVGLPLGYASYRQTHFRNFHVVRPGVLYRSGQMSLTGLERVLYDHGIRTVVTLRDEGRGREAEPVVARLEADLFAELRAHGTIRLPDPPPAEPVEELLRQAHARLAEQRGRGPRPGQT